MSKLKGAQQKFAESADNVEKLESNNAGKFVTSMMTGTKMFCKVVANLVDTRT